LIARGQWGEHELASTLQLMTLSKTGIFLPAHFAKHACCGKSIKVACGKCKEMRFIAVHTKRHKLAMPNQTQVLTNACHQFTTENLNDAQPILGRVHRKNPAQNSWVMRINGNKLVPGLRGFRQMEEGHTFLPSSQFQNAAQPVALRHRSNQL